MPGRRGRHVADRQIGAEHSLAAVLEGDFGFDPPGFGAGIERLDEALIAFGDGRDFVTALINIDLEAVGNWAERRSLAYASYQELAGNELVYDLVQGCIDQANRDLAAEPSLAASQIRRFLILHKELDADDGELTRTRKVRRSVIGEKYGDIVTAIYAGRPEIDIDTLIRFQDGTTQRVQTTLAVVDLDAAEPGPVTMAAE